MSGLTKDIATGGIKTVASFAGRAWYAGIDSVLEGGDERSPLLSSYVAFSQIVENESQLNKCYQEADPTSDIISDIIATDGGLIQIPEMSRCLKMINMGRSIVVIASNGVWEISGGEANFSATSFQVSKVSNVGALSAESIVDAEGAVFYWSRGGIYQLSYEQVSQSAKAQNITETTIQGFLDAIPSLNKTFVQGSYDPAAKKVVWLFNDTAGFDGVTEPYKYNRKLTLDLVLSAFYPATFGSLGDGFPYVAGLFVTPETVKTDYDYNLARTQDNVIVGTDSVVVRQQIRATTTSRTKYLAMYPDHTSLAAFSIAYERDSDFVDWQTIDTVGVDSPAFMITGYELLGDIQRDKQVPYLTMHFERTETGFEQNGDDLTPIGESSCRVQAQWDFANSATSGKYGDEFEAYRLLRNYTPSGTSDTFDYGYRVITTKTSLRGSGKALSLKLSSSAGKDLHVLGWAINSDGGVSV
jgi:hypothetical protein